MSSASAGPFGDGAIVATSALFVAALLAVGCQPKVSPEAEGDCSPEAEVRHESQRVEIKDGDRVVWLGDSITHHAQYTQYLETFFVTRYPHWSLKFHNAGIAGDRVGDVLARYAHDEFAQQADLSVVLLGMNDGGFRRYRDEIGETFRNDLSTLLDRLAENGSRTLLISPTVYDVEAEWRDQLRDGEVVAYDDPKLLGYDAVLERFGEMAQALAFDRGLAFAEVRGPLLEAMKKARRGDVSFSLIPDSLHPSAAGHAIMAVTILRETFEYSPVVSDVEIALNPDDPAAPWVISAKQAEVSQSSSRIDEKGITHLAFHLLEKSLPWLVPDEARDGFDAVDGSALNRQMLKIQELPSASFALSIDDALVGVFSSSALENGIDLAKTSYTPQRQQAAQVAELNRLRNSGPVRSMQDWQVDHKHRSAAIAAASDELEKAQLQTEFDEWSPLFEQAILDLSEQADEWWQKIYTAAQPVKRVYQLQRLADDYRPFGAGK